MATKPEMAGAAARGAAIEILEARQAAEGEQLDLLALPCEDATGRIADARDRTIGQKGVGRPKGATNLSNRAMREYLLKVGVNPLESLMKWFLLGPDGFAEWAGVAGDDAIGRLECLKLWKNFGADLTPYFASRMLPVDGKGNAPPFIVMNIGGEGSGVVVNGEKLPPWEYTNQSLSEGAPALAKDEESKE